METRRIELSQVITDIAAGPFGSNLKVSCFVDEGFPIIDGANLKGFKVTDNLTKFVTEEKARSLHRSIAKRRDVIVTISGTVGQIAYIPDDSAYEEYLCSQRQFRATFDEEKVYVPYLVFYFHTYEGNHKILSFANQTGVPALSQPLKNFKKIEINLPDLATQKRIAAVVESLNDKIKKNDEINENLEEQIETLLLTFLDNEDAVPVKLGDYLYIKGRIGWKGLKKSEYLPQSEYRIINGESLTQSGIDWNKAGYISEERYVESPEIMLKVGDILLSKDGTIGKIGYVDSLELPTSVASGIFVIRNTKPDIISTTFIYYLLKSQLFSSFIAARTEGSVIPHLYQKDFMDFEFPLPIPDKMAEFEEITDPMFSQIINNLNENKCLALLRDTLLPRLMSGELDVSSLDL